MASAFLASSNACTSLSSSLTNVRLIKVKSTVGYWAIEAAANFEAVSPAESEMTKIVTHFFSSEIVIEGKSFLAFLIILLYHKSRIYFVMILI